MNDNNEHPTINTRAELHLWRQHHPDLVDVQIRSESPKILAYVFTNNISALIFIGEILLFDEHIHCDPQNPCIVLRTVPQSSIKTVEIKLTI
jgi:hypothetical protein